MRRLLYSLRSRMFVAFAALLVLSAVLLGWLSLRQQKEELHGALIVRGQIIARQLAYGAELGVLTEDEHALAGLLRKTLRGQKGILFAEIYDADGGQLAVLSSSSAGDLAVDHDPDEGAIRDVADRPSWSHLGAGIYEFRMPVVEEVERVEDAMLMESEPASLTRRVIGMAHVALDDRAIRAATQRLLQHGAVVLSVLLLVALLAAWWLSRLLTARLERVGVVVDRVEAGDFRGRVAVTGDDEVAGLGKAFNQMLDALEEREAALHRQQLIMQTILDHAPIGVWMQDVDGKLSFVNGAWCEALGLSQERLLAAAHYTDLLPESLARVCAASDGFCLSGDCYHGTCVVTHAESGEQRTFEVIKVPVRDDDGAVRALVGLAIDITKRLAIEAEREAMQKQVEHTQRLESLGVLAGGIAHDFNNILTAIMGNAALASRKMQQDPDAGSVYLDKIVQASERAALLCRQMLAYSGKGQFVIKPVNLSVLVRSITSLLEVSVHRTIELEYRLDDELPLIEADEAQLQQVVMNLVINASDAIGEQRGRIVLESGTATLSAEMLADILATTGGEASPGRFVFLDVSDDGCGMSGETMQRLFEPFFTTKFTGRGLGMSAVLGIIRGHRGAIQVKSEECVGTCFRVLFPVADESVVSPPEAVSGEVEQQAAEPNAGNGTVLVVDDEESIREAAAAMLEDMGFSVLTAEDGEQAVACYRQHRDGIALVLLDMTMPRMDGAACFAAMREIDPEVKVLLSSGFSEREAMLRFRAEGPASFIQKPYWPDALEAKVREVLA